MKTITNSALDIRQSGNTLNYDLTEILFCLSIGSIFLPWKLYPGFFLIQSFYCAISTYRNNRASLSDFLRQKWIYALWIFTAYAVFSYFFLVSEHPAAMSSNLLKMLVNILFLTSTVYWLENRSFSSCLPLLNGTLHLIFFLCLIQLLVYHQAFHFHLLSGASSSAKGSILYNKALFFWGLPDKNMFGARLALLGFIYLLIPLVQRQRISCFRIALIFLLAFLSLSRTPLVALLIGVFLLVWVGTSPRVRIALAIGLLAATPFIGQKLLRTDQLLASNDGMGVRITYWKAFFKHFSSISPWGNGFLNGGRFLQRFADYYHGEPHIHNTFLSTYLELGIIGFLSYIGFLWFFYRRCSQVNVNQLFWLIGFLPLLSIMMILYSGYDNDILLYLALLFALGSAAPLSIRPLKISML